MRTLLVSVLVFVITVASAQDYEFKVLASKGDVKLVNSGSEKALYTGGKVLKGTSVKLGEGSYLALVHSSGKSMELRKSGTYKASELTTAVGSGKKGFAEKYANFAWDQMTASNDQGRNMKITGSVMRDISSIKGFSVRKSNVMSSSVLLKWTEVENAKTYKVSVVNRYEEAVLSFTTTSNSFKLDLENLDFSTEKVYLWDVEVVEWTTESSKSVKSDKYALNYMGDEKAASVKEEYTNLASELNPDASALDAIIIASFYEQNEMFLDAMTYYEKAIKQAPEVNDYKVAYKSFLEKNGLGDLMN